MAPQNFIRIGTFVTAAGLILQPAFGQGRGTTTGSTGAGSTTGAGATTTAPSPTTTTRPTTTPTQPTTTTQPTQPAQPIFISGRVMLEDGAPPSESVVIERVCSGAPHSEGYTDSKGYFSIRLGDPNNGVLHDASEDMTGFGSSNSAAGGGFGGATSSMSGSTRGLGSDNRFFDCELRARLVGYRSQSVSLANRRPMDPPDIGVILLHRLGASEGSTVSAASLAAPKDARKAFDKGMDALKKHKPDDAMKNFEKTVEIYPKHAAAWTEMGRLHMAKGDPGMAKGSFEKAVEIDPKFVAPYLEIAMIEWKAQNWQSLADLTEKVVKLDSFDYPQAHFLNALSNYYLKNMEAAEKSAREAVRLDTRRQYVTTLRLLGVILAQKQDYTGASEQLKAYLQFAPQASDAATVRTQLGQLEQLMASKK
jgi:tetratricopeptide (TPR) repeat protein